MSFVTDQRNAQAAALQAALAWWESRRPVGWDLRRHLDNSTVNTCGEAEKLLAAAVGQAVEVGVI